jgi:signal transduction histidine kinase
MDSGGLGWFIALRVVKEHEGRLRVESGEWNNALSIELQLKKNDEPL